MADYREERIYCAEQIQVPYDLPSILKHYSKEVIRQSPDNILEFSSNYFANLVELREKYGKDTPLDELVKLDQKQDLK